MTTVNEVYARNIPERLIIERLAFVDPDVDAGMIEDERQKFKAWLDARYEKLGKLLPDQMLAWEIYDTRERLEREKQRVYNSELVEERGYKTWEEEIIEILETLATANTGNYNEFGGQQ